MIKSKCVRPTTIAGRYYRPGDIAALGVVDHPCFTRRPVAFAKLPKAHGRSVVLLADGPSGRNYAHSGWPVMVVNRAGVRYQGPVEYWASMHPQYLALWAHQRRKKVKAEEDITFVSHLAVRNPTIALLPWLAVQGSSSLLALFALEMMGYEHIHLVGVDFTGPYSCFCETWNAYTPTARITSAPPHTGYRR